MILLIIIGIVLLIINPLLFLAYVLLFAFFVFLSFYVDMKQTQNVRSAIVVSRTQVTKEVYQRSGFSVGSSGHSRFYWRTKNVPDHVEVLFDVTYTNGSVRRVKAIDGTGKYEKLMSYVGKQAYSQNDKNQTKQNHGQPNHAQHETIGSQIEIKKNQLTAGVYIIGKNIPSGRYDLIWVWGEGKIEKYADETTTLGASNYFQWIGNEYKYQRRQCVGVLCLDGEYLRIGGNVVVEIKRSKEIEIDL